MCTQSALPGCTKEESHGTRGFYEKPKICRNIAGVFHFYISLFVLLYLLKVFSKILKELLHLITLHPKLIPWSAVKKALMILEDTSNQTQ